MTREQDKSLLARLPNELYYTILEILGEEDETQRASLGILNLALSGYEHFTFVSAWCDRKTKADLATLNSLKQGNLITPSIYRQTGLAVLCKRVAGICAICNNRATRREPDEFLNLRLCHACTPFFSPKISDIRGEIYFKRWSNVTFSGVKYVYIQRGGYESINGIITFIQRPVKVFSWWDIKKLVYKGAIFPKIIRGLSSRNLQHLATEAEDYGELNDWGGTRGSRSLSSILWNQFQNRWNLPCRLEVTPLAMDMAFFKEFRYRFDPSWSPQSREEELRIYGNIMRYWAFHEVWGDRPWRAKHFPRQPRLRLIEGAVTYLPPTSVDQDLYKQHQSQCSRIRRAMKEFRNILQYPGRWLQTVNEVRNLKAQEADLADTEDFVEIELAKSGIEVYVTHRTTKDQLCTNWLTHSELRRK